MKVLRIICLTLAIAFTVPALADLTAGCDKIPNEPGMHCPPNTRMIRAVGIVPNSGNIARDYFYRAHPLYRYALAASAANASIKEDLWNRVEGSCALLYDPCHSLGGTMAWGACRRNCQAERQSAPTIINYDASSQVAVCFDSNPLRLAFEADWNYLQARLACFQGVTAHCSPGNDNFALCQQALAQCGKLDAEACDICFAGATDGEVIKKKLANGQTLPPMLEVKVRGGCYAYCSSILQPTNLRELYKLNPNTISLPQGQVPHLEISDDGGMTYTRLTSI